MPKSNIKSLIKQLRAGDVRSLARVLSHIEDSGIEGRLCVEELFPYSGRAFVVGITGSPGAGKSTLVDQLVKEYVKCGSKVGVIAVDPSSPFTGGALLGDRIRMSQATSISNVFVRSMASRGALGGLAPRASEAIFAFDAAGYDVVIVETVGVGQGEVEIVRLADTVNVVLVPGMGDGVQAMKAGLLEIADIFVINKSDYPNADRLEKELKTVLGLVDNLPWRPEIIKTVASEGKGSDELKSAIDRHIQWARSSGAASTRREKFLKQAFNRSLAEVLVESTMAQAESKGLVEPIISKLNARELAPHACAQALIQAVKNSA